MQNKRIHKNNLTKHISENQKRGFEFEEHSANILKKENPNHIFETAQTPESGSGKFKNGHSFIFEKSSDGDILNTYKSQFGTTALNTYNEIAHYSRLYKDRETTFVVPFGQLEGVRKLADNSKVHRDLKFKECSEPMLKPSEPENSNTGKELSVSDEPKPKQSEPENSNTEREMSEPMLKQSELENSNTEREFREPMLKQSEPENSNTERELSEPVPKQLEQENSNTGKELEPENSNTGKKLSVSSEPIPKNSSSRYYRCSIF